MKTTKILDAFRNAGLSVDTKFPKDGTEAKDTTNVILLNGRVLNVCTYSVVGFGQYGTPSYETARKELCKRVVAVLTRLGVHFSQSLPDQYILSAEATNA